MSILPLLAPCGSATAAAATVFGGAPTSVEHVGGTDQRLTVRVTLQSNVPAAQILSDAGVTV